jgi:hypothetical protein
MTQNEYSACTADEFLRVILPQYMKSVQKFCDSLLYAFCAFCAFCESWSRKKRVKTLCGGVSEKKLVTYHFLF